MPYSARSRSRTEPSSSTTSTTTPCCACTTRRGTSIRSSRSRARRWPRSIPTTRCRPPAPASPRPPRSPPPWPTPSPRRADRGSARSRFTRKSWSEPGVARAPGVDQESSMNEMRALVEAFDAANLRGERCALATVVSVEGSSYRRPGARMLVRETGLHTGTISAGCLESDVVEHAKRVLQAGAAKLVEYNTATTSDEEAWGLGLGCNGIVRVLVEPLAAGSLYIEALRRSCEAPPDAAPLSVATVYQHASSTGARLFIDEKGDARHETMS